VARFCEKISNQKYQFGQILEGLAMEDVGLLYDHWFYSTAIWYTLWSFGIFYGYIFGIRFPVLVCCTIENLATLLTMPIIHI
jgi:hypothetical protein